MISVVIPLYNKEKSVRTTLNSVRAQSFTDWECIVVDDGSTDKSREVVEQIKIEDLRFKILSQPNSGVSAARNAGIMAAKGEYVTFLDADDLWTEDFLATIAALIQEYPNAGLYSTGYLVTNSSTLLNREQLERYNPNPFRGFVQTPWNNSLRLYVGSVCGRREKIIEMGMFDTRMTHGEDYDFCWRMMLEGGLVRDSKCCAFYRQDTENRAMHKMPPLDKMMAYYIDKFADARAQNADFRKFYDEQMIYRLYPYMLSKTYRNAARRIARQFDYGQLKLSMWFRMKCPWMYHWLKKGGGSNR